MFRAITLAALIALPTVSHSAPQCGPRDEAVKILKDKYGETQQFYGLNRSRTVVLETYANLVTGTWSLLRTEPSGRTCLVASGNEFYAIPQGDGL